MTHTIFSMSAGDKNELFQSWVSPESILQLAKDDAGNTDILGKGEAYSKSERICICMSMLSKCCKEPSVLASYVHQIVEIYGGWIE
jgi:hypothetical protein